MLWLNNSAAMRRSVANIHADLWLFPTTATPLRHEPWFKRYQGQLDNQMRPDLAGEPGCKHALIQSRVCARRDNGWKA